MLAPIAHRVTGADDVLALLILGALLFVLLAVDARSVDVTTGKRRWE